MIKAGTTTGEPRPQPASAADRGCQQQRQALPRRQRPDPAVEGRRPRSRDGDLLRPAQFSGAPEPLVTYDLIGINSIVQGCNTRATSPSLAMDLHPDSGLKRRRKLWAPL